MYQMNKQFSDCRINILPVWIPILMSTLNPVASRTHLCTTHEKQTNETHTDEIKLTSQK